MTIIDWIVIGSVCSVLIGVSVLVNRVVGGLFDVMRSFDEAYEREVAPAFKLEAERVGIYFKCLKALEEKKRCLK